MAFLNVKGIFTFTFACGFGANKYSMTTLYGSMKQVT